MTCFYPVRGFRGPGGTLVPSRSKSTLQVPVVVPCGRCMGCRVDRSRDWAVRIAHEASLFEDNIFLTLTYSDEHCPSNGTLVKKHIQDFMKRLRKHLNPPKKKGEKPRPPHLIRYFACGEYGKKTFRPHYHLIIFNYRPSDLWLWNVRNGEHVFRSPTLEKLWPFGMHEFGSVTAASGGYVARYCIKSQDQAADRYMRWDSETGEHWEVLPEFLLMSKKPPIGRRWFDRYASDCFPSDFLVVDGRKTPVPKAYRKYLSESDEEARRKRGAHHRHDPSFKANSTDERLAVREQVKAEKLARLKREL